METLLSLEQQAQDIAAAYGFAPIDWDPSHSSVLQSAVAPQQAPVVVSTAPSTAPAPSTSTMTFSNLMTQPVLMGFTAPEVALGAAGLYFLWRMTKKKRR